MIGLLSDRSTIDKLLDTLKFVVLTWDEFLFSSDPKSVDLMHSSMVERRTFLPHSLSIKTRGCTLYTDKFASISNVGTRNRSYEVESKYSDS